jgi:hypothetical protein
MPAQLEVEEELIRQEREQSAAERRDRNALAIDEVVGRNPVNTLQKAVDKVFEHFPPNS